MTAVTVQVAVDTVVADTVQVAAVPTVAAAVPTVVVLILVQVTADQVQVPDQVNLAQDPVQVNLQVKVKVLQVKQTSTKTIF